MKFRYIYFALSGFFLLAGLISLVLFGLRPAIDFTGGTLLEVRIEKREDAVPPTPADLTQLFEENKEIVVAQQTGSQQFLLRGRPLNNEEKTAVEVKIEEKYGAVTELRFETVGPTLGRELLRKTIFAGVIAAAIIIMYIWSQFDDVKFGVAAVLAMLHDGVIVIGAFSIFGKLFNVEVDVLFVTALLTVLSFSVHDTIVVFDRIREMSKKHPRVPMAEIMNGAVLQTLGRSINNSMTIILMLSCLVVLGGDTIRWFAVALLVGAVTGTYSSTFTAVPLLLVWDEVKGWRKRKGSEQKNQSF